MLDMECAPALIVIASDAAHRGNVTVVIRPMYCRASVVYCLMFFVICLFLTYLFLTQILSMLIQLEGVWTV